MKKSFVLGAAALAAMAVAAPQGAMADEMAEPVYQPQTHSHSVKFGGYYMFRIQDSDPTVSQDTSGGADNARYWAHRIQVNMDMTASPKTHAHMRTRIVDSGTVTGADMPGYGQGGNHAADHWDIRQLWLETELWGIGTKVGHMPISLNDRILMATDTTGFATIMLSKTFGDVTAVAANVRVNEDNRGVVGTGGDNSPTTCTGGAVLGASANCQGGADEDDEDLYFLSLFGKYNGWDWNLTGAYFVADSDSDYANAGGNGAAGTGTQAGDSATDGWVALTASTDLTPFGAPVDLTGTMIYETGMEGYTVGGQAEEDGWLGAVRLKGNTSFGGWNAYGFYASQDFTNITNDNMQWSKTWDMGGPGAKDLLGNWAADAGASESENMSGVGLGMTFSAGGWKINPMIDFAAVVEEDLGNNGVADQETDSAWGGTLALSTKVDEGTTLFITGVYVDPDQNDNSDTVDTVENMHFVEASIKMKF